MEDPKKHFKGLKMINVLLIVLGLITLVIGTLQTFGILSLPFIVMYSLIFIIIVLIFIKSVFTLKKHE
ncbi:hypothetical protein CD155_10935 [Staphylococcus caprae]|nr:hypothetical protein CD155_10935 [Staphylococcus caprae]SUL94483.1 Uncharacterised protein [Staphylococcus caprae]